MRNGAIAALCLGMLLQACGGANTRPASTPAPATQQPARPPIAPQPVPELRVQRLPGVEGVIGANAAALLGQFGAPRIDLTEGDARKLQFAGTACVLDIYLYPTGSGGEQRATHVEARRANDARDTDRADCIEALRAR